MSTTMAQFIFKKTCPKNMRMKAPITPLSAAVANAEKMNGAEMNRPAPQITEIFFEFFFALHIIFIQTNKQINKQMNKQK